MSLDYHSYINTATTFVHETGEYLKITGEGGYVHAKKKTKDICMFQQDITHKEEIISRKWKIRPFTDF
jgi:hypothetical protein